MHDADALHKGPALSSAPVLSTADIILPFELIHPLVSRPPDRINIRELFRIGISVGEGKAVHILSVPSGAAGCQLLQALHGIDTRVRYEDAEFIAADPVDGIDSRETPAQAFR